MDLSKLPAWVLAIAMAVIAILFTYVLITQPKRFEFAGLGFGVAPTADMTLTGAVVAFDKADTDEDGECPDGWSLFKPAIGRMVIGADNNLKEGEPENARLLLPSYSENTAKATGGEVRHTLNTEEMPAHRHELKTSPDPGTSGVMSGAAQTSDRNVNSSLRGVTGGSETGTAAHNNMPPYIALYFCKKEG